MYSIQDSFNADHHKTTELKDLRELVTHGILKMLGFCLCHLTTGEIKHFFAALKDFGLQKVNTKMEDLPQQLQNDHIILTEGFTCLAGTNQFTDECWPVVRPFILDNLHHKQCCTSKLTATAKTLCYHHKLLPVLISCPVLHSKFFPTIIQEIKLTNSARLFCITHLRC